MQPGGEFTDLPTAEVNLVDVSVDSLGAIVEFPRNSGHWNSSVNYFWRNFE
jgi:hypothetical protein